MHTCMQVLWRVTYNHWSPVAHLYHRPVRELADKLLELVFEAFDVAVAKRGVCAKHGMEKRRDA